MSQRTAVELVGEVILLGQLIAGVGDGVLETAGLAGLACEHHVESVDEEGGGGGDEDVA